MRIGLGVSIAIDGAPAGPQTPTPPSIADQTITYGARTLEDAGGWRPLTSGGAITSWSITAGNGSGHWQIDDGYITPTAQGDTDDLDDELYTLTVEVTNGDDTDSATITIITAGEDINGNDLAYSFSVRDMTEALAAAEVVAAAPWLWPDPPGNLIDYPNGRHYIQAPPGDWTFVSEGSEYPTAWDLNDATAPNGETEAWLYVEGGSGPGDKPWTFWADKTKSLGTSPQTFTGSIYAKRGPGNNRNIGLVLQSPHSGDNYAEVMFDLSTGAMSLQGQLDSATLIDSECIDVGDGWFWCKIVAEVAEANATVHFGVYQALTTGLTFTSRVVYTGNATSGTYFWRGRLAEGNELL